MNEEDLGTHLARLGLTRHQAEVYEALLAGGPCSRGELAGRLGRDVRAEELDGRLAELRRLGLITAAGPDGGEHTPVEPSLALDHLAHTRTAELHRAHQAAVNAYRGYRRTVSPQATEDLLEVVTGPAVAERIRQIEETAESEVLRFDSPPYHTDGTANPLEERNLERGVAYRVVYSRSAVENTAYYEINIRPCIAAGEHARVLPTVPVKLTVFDGRLAIVSMSFVEAEVNDSLLLVHPSSLLSALTGLFETSWRTALPMHRGSNAPPGLGPVHRRILELLATGVTDDTIAELLGVSRRTLSRHLEQIGARAGSRTRFQLALQAARNGWL